MMKAIHLWHSGTAILQMFIQPARDLAADYPLILGALGHATILTSMSYTLDAMSGLCRLDTATVLDPYGTEGGERFVSAYEWASVNFAAEPRTEAF